MTLRTNTLLAIAAVAGIASSAQALVWTGANVADDKTIALYHFDETGGSVASNSVGTYPSINLNAAATWSGDAGWLSSPSGMSLGASGSGYAGVTASQGTIDWGLPGITVSLWMKATGNPDQDNNMFYMGHDGWRNVQGFVGYHTQWADQYLRVAGAEAGKRTGNGWLGTAIDGQWHHMAIVYDNAADLGSFYFDNVKQTEWSVAGGYSAQVTEFMYIARLQGNIDELLIQGEIMTDFSNGLNVPEPASLALLGLASLALFRRRHA